MSQAHDEYLTACKRNYAAYRSGMLTLREYAAVGHAAAVTYDDARQAEAAAHEDEDEDEDEDMPQNAPGSSRSAQRPVGKG